MLPLEKQVTSLALSKRLEAAGLPTDTYFAWTMNELGEWYVAADDYEGPYGAGWDRLAPAYTTDELLEWLRGQGCMPALYLLSDHAEAYDAMVPRYETYEAATPAEALGLLALKVKETR